MKLQRVGNALIRSDVSSPLLAFLAPAVARSTLTTPHQRLSLSKTYPGHISPRRCFAAAPTQQAAAPRFRIEEEVGPDARPSQARPLGTTTSTTHGANLSDRAQPQRPTPSQLTTSSSAHIQDMLNDMRLPRSPSARRTAPRSIPSSSSALMDEALRKFYYSPTATGQRQDTLARAGSSNADLMKDIQGIGKSQGSSIGAAPPAMRLDAYMGRAEEVNNKAGRPLIRALALLDINCRANKVRQTMNYQRFHERKGLKRKRLKSQRWRRRFMEGFKEMVQKVGRMRKQGW